ncbi:TPA: hypothetical protein ACIVNJ_002813, partial [Salmonella enterica subsp. diarizonae serovar 61:r:-]
QGERSESIPLTAILKKEFVRKYGLFFALSHPSIAGWRRSSQAPYPVYISAAPPGNKTTIRLSILAKNFREFNFAPLV